MTKFKITTVLELFKDAYPEVEHELRFMNSCNEWEGLGFFHSVELAKDYAEKFAAVYKEEIFSI